MVQTIFLWSKNSFFDLILGDKWTTSVDMQLNIDITPKNSSKLTENHNK